MESAQPRAWLLMAAGDNRGHAGNGGYDDQVDAYYSWDSNVPNSRKLAVGDPIALWDKERLLGVSVIEEIETSRGTKVLNRCPQCGATRIRLRKRARPRFRCAKSPCSHEFDQPQSEVVAVDVFRARYDAGWTSLDGLLAVQEIRRLASHDGDFNAMRPIDWDALRGSLLEKHAERAVERLTGRMPLGSQQALSRDSPDWPQGFRQTLVRVRRGQSQFREQLLAQQGNICAFTGRAPERVLEAGHLYSYAKLGEHHRHGGLMLRRDVHRLFDDGSLAVEPSRLSVDVAPELKSYPQYAQLQGRALTVDLRPEQVNWLHKHWLEHRTQYKNAP